MLFEEVLQGLQCYHPNFLSDNIQASMLDIAMKGGLNIPKDLFMPLLCVPDYCLTWSGIKLGKPGYHTVTFLMKSHC